MKIEIKGSCTRLIEDASLIQNSATSYGVEFTFNEAWDGFAKTALFEAGSASIAVVLTDDKCTVPAECLKRAGVRLQVMVYGVKGDACISTGWCVTSMILHKVSLGLGSGGGGSTLPDDVYEQIMGAIGDLVQKEDGAGLYPDEDKEKLAGIVVAEDTEITAMLDEVFGTAQTEPEVTEP